MKLLEPKTVEQIAKILNLDFLGDKDIIAYGINESHFIEKNDIVFVDDPRYYSKIMNSEASIVIVNKQIEHPKSKAIIMSENPFNDFSKLIEHFSTNNKPEAKISSTAVVGDKSYIGRDVYLGENVVIGRDSYIGSDTHIHPNVVIGNGIRIGKNVIIGSGTIIGSDAFYYKQDKNGKYHKLFSGAGVFVGDDVHIGANNSIDRGITTDTTIKNGSKIDNFVHIGHDTTIGNNCLIAAQVGIAGCVTVEDNVTIWGQVGISSGLRIGKNVVVLAKSGVSKSLSDGNIYFGIPAVNIKEKYRELAYIKKMFKNNI